MTSATASLSPQEKRTLLAQLLRKKAEGAKLRPLSFAQQRLWFLDQWQPGSTVYNVPLATRLNGALDLSALEQSLNELVERHDVLRTTFAADAKGKPVQVVAARLYLALPVVDLQETPAPEREQRARELAVTEAQHAFDLARGPLVRARLLRLDESSHVLLLTLHHIIADAWSLGVLVRDFAALYEAHVNGTAPSLPLLGVQYADYAIWQRKWLEGDVLDEQLGYWKRQLANLPALDLWGDRARPLIQSFRGAHHAFVLPVDLVREVRQLARQIGGTPFMVLLAAFHALLGRCAGQEDVAVGSPVANRQRGELEPLIGFFVNTLVLRADLSGDPSFRELLGRVRDNCLGAYAHQDLPFERLVEELQPQRDTSRNPLFQVLFVYQNTPMPVMKMAGLEVCPWDIDNGTSKFDLSLFLIDMAGDGPMRCILEYSTDLFAADTIGRLAERYITLLQGAIADPATPLSRLPLLSATEKQQVLEGFNASARSYPNRHLLHDLIAQQVARSPEAPAVVFDDVTLSYAELERRANRLAHRLTRLGAAPDRPVALFMERSTELLVALLACLKAGAAYLPLEPDHPALRLTGVLDEARPPLLLCQPQLRQRLPHADIAVLCILPGGTELQNTDLPLTQEPDTTPDVDVQPDHLAYVIYTSGSTGMPKGAMNTHRGICNRLLWMQAEYCLSGRDTVLQKTPYGFDVSVWEFFWPLLAGARLVLAEPGGHKDPAYLAGLIERQRVSVLHFVPSMLRVFLQEADLESKCRTVRDVICSGEALAGELAGRFFQAMPQARLHNLYGPTEAAVDVTYWQCRPEDAGGAVPIGRPVANTQLYVLDGHMQPVPVGVAGELYIGGVQVARGYLARPELTSERFVPDPYGTTGGRLYRTGDRGRWRSDGVLEYLGRLDDQVKVRGQRIELGDIEAALLAHPGVDQATAIVREDQPGEPRLVGYVVPRESFADSVHQEPNGALDAEQVAHWQAVWQDTYGQKATCNDATFNTVGWNSSYTALPIPDEEMREWLDQTVARIRSLGPRRVLEIGCGTGMLLFRLAPVCSAYIGTDFSEAGISSLRRELAGRNGEYAAVRVEHAAADDLTGIDVASFDTIVLNSVVQYFPSVHYLIRVLDNLARHLRPGAHVFLGDLRDYRLLEAFHTSVQMHKAPAALPRDQLQARIGRHMAQERELLIDPALFAALALHLPGKPTATVHCKRGRHHNELTKFRFDAILHWGTADNSDNGDCLCLNWQTDRLDLGALRRILDERSPAVLQVKGIPNARLSGKIMALRLLHNPDGLATAGDLRDAVHQNGNRGSIDPQDVWALEKELPYNVTITCLAAGDAACFDATFRSQRASEALLAHGQGLSRHDAAPVGAWDAFANNPMRRVLAQRLIPELRLWLQQRLPESMVPAAFVLLQTLPVNHNGKLDRKALPAPEQGHPELQAAFVAPRTPMETTLAQMWADVLGLERVGVQDNFFELGGHSLLATQVMSRLRSALQIEIPLRVLFEAPTVSALAERVEKIRLAALGLLAAPLQPIARDGELPLSFGQETFWFLDQLEPNSAVFNIDAAVRLRGPLDSVAVQQTIDALLGRHEALTTTFAAVQGKPMAVLTSAPPAPVPIIDLENLDAAERHAEAVRYAKEEARRPFDLARGPLFRLSLLRLGAEDHVALLTVHHAVFDGWSLGVFLAEAGLLYEGFRHGKPTGLPKLPIQYIDFAHWQRQWLRSGLMADQLAYWQKQLAGKLPPLELPTDRPRPAVRTFHGARMLLRVPPALAEAIRGLGRQEGCTLFMTLLAAFKCLLFRWTGQEDINVGAPIANRNRTETEGLIGFFVNTLVLRTDLSGRPTFRALLRRVKETALGAYAHQDLPFEMLVQTLRPDRDPSRSALFQVMFILQNAPLKVPQLAGLATGPLVELADNGTSKFELMLTFMEGDAGLAGTIEYNTDLFDAATIERVAGHYQTLLAAVAADPDQPIATVPLLTAAERCQLERWNETGTDYPAGTTILDQFEARAAETPDAIAVVGESEKISYRRLNERANQLAQYLRGRAVGPESIVGVFMDKCPDLLVAILGILKAGGAYIPLDPLYPGERLCDILDDARPALVLTRAALRNDLPATAPEVFCLDADWSRLAGEEVGNFERTAMAQNLAYLIYTSGSTGKPKGVMITHGSLCNAYHAWQDVYRLRTEVRCHLQMASVAFDVFTGDWVRALGSGGRLVLCPRETLLDPGQLYDLMLREQVDCAEFVPAVLRHLVAWLERTGRDLRFLRLLVAGSDIWYMEEYRKIHSLCGAETRVVNSYGLTEATIDSTFFEGTAAESPEDRSVPIGRPFPNTQTHILDSNLQPAPVGVPGELYVGGCGLARGYFQRPELDAEKFLADPFVSATGARLFRTGDLGRRLSDGTIELLGRTDHQVKIRGHRIELGEIEALLAQHPDVVQAVVMACPGGRGNKRLVAFVRSNPAAAPSSQQLRRYLQQKLPEYMVPASVAFVEAFPLTPHGKVDRQALLCSDAVSLPNAQREYVAPRNPIETQLANIWATVLGLERVGIHDHFFDLGGHSLLATQVLARLRAAFGVEVPLRRLFEAPTLVELAEAIEVAQAAAPPITQRDWPGPAPLSFAQERLWFLDQLEPGSAAYNIPAAVRLSGSLDADLLRRSLQAVVERHQALRTSFVAVEGRPAQVIGAAATADFDLTDLCALAPGQQEQEIQRLARCSAQQPFDLSRGPLLRAALLRLGTDEHVVLLCVHHIVFDGWSMGVFLRDLVAIYQGLVGGQAIVLPDLPVSYVHYAAWQRDWLQGDTLEKQIAYWRNRLADAPAGLELPTDRPRPIVQTFRGATAAVHLPQELVGRLQSLGRANDATLYMTLLAALNVLLYRLSGQTDICVGSPVAGRHHPEVENLIGLFVNTLVLRTDLGGKPTFRQLLGRVRETALGAYSHQDLPFEKLVEILQPQRDLGRSVLFQVLFVLQNAPKGQLDVPALAVRPLDVDSGTAKFDLSLGLVQTPHGLEGGLEHNSDLFDAATVQRLLGHWQTLLNAIVAHPDRSIGELALLEESERRQLLDEWNRTGADYPADRCIPWLFERQAAQCPDAIAVKFHGETLTYADLNRRANQLAHYLRSHGVSPDTVVGVCLERSVVMAVAVLGILKAGGAFLPLDPAYPQDRLAFMVRDSKAPVVLTLERLRGRLPDDGVDVIALDADEDPIAQSGAANPNVAADPESLAYVIYTSGSTGQPKGVAMPHRPLVNLIHWQLSQSVVGQGETTLQFTTLSFDVAFQEIFATWCAGGTLVLMSEEQRQDLHSLPQLLRDQEIARLFLPFVALQELAEACAACKVFPESLREIITAGEQLQITPAVAQLFTQLPRCSLHNHFGPTEAHVVTAHRLTGEPRQWPALAPIGRPIFNCQVYVLDPCLQPVPIGVTGELYLAGVCLAHGYLHRPELTAERFVANSFQPGARMYRTGDWCRWLANGDLQFLGRQDHQVKIRGFRVELGEIETVLSRHPSVREAVVTVDEEQPGEKTLTAYVVPRAGTPAAAADIRAWLRQHLPDYMTPSAFMFLESLPLTPSGKVNRRALPSPRRTRQNSGQPFVAPRDELEEQLAQVWADVLSLPRVGVEDDFFELGGHSLLAVRLMARVEKNFGEKLPLATLFQQATVARQARMLRQKQNARRLGWPGGKWSSMVSIRDTGSGPRFCCVHPVGGNVVCYADLAKYMDSQQSFYGIQSYGQHGDQQPYTRVEDMAAHYVRDLRELEPQGPYYLGGWSLGGVLAYEMACQLEAQDQKVGLLALLDTRAPGFEAEEVKDSDEVLFIRFVLDRGMTQKQLALAWSQLQQLDREAQIGYLLEQVRKVDFELAEISDGELRRIVQLFMSNLRAVQNYEPGKYGGRIVLFRAQEGFEDNGTPHDLGWAQLAAGGVEVCVVPGDHGSMTREPHVRELARHLQRHLTVAQHVPEEIFQP